MKKLYLTYIAVVEVAILFIHIAFYLFLNFQRPIAICKPHYCCIVLCNFSTPVQLATVTFHSRFHQMFCTAILCNWCRDGRHPIDHRWLNCTVRQGISYWVRPFLPADFMEHCVLPQEAPIHSQHWCGQYFILDGGVLNCTVNQCFCCTHHESPSCWFIHWGQS